MNSIEECPRHAKWLRASGRRPCEPRGPSILPGAHRLHFSLPGLTKSWRRSGFLGLLSFLLAAAPVARAQGLLTPPGAPAPTMKSLQEIWDKVGTLQTTVSTLQTTVGTLQTSVGTLQTTVSTLQTSVATLQTQNQTLQQQVTSQQKDSAAFGLLLANTNIVLPWNISTVDSTGAVGQYTSLAFTPAGQPAISYYDTTNQDLKYAVFNGSAWSLSTVDNAGFVGQNTSLAFTPAGQPAISYYDVSNSRLKYAVYNGSTWTLGTVDSTGSVGSFTSLAFTPAGQPAISYYDGSNGHLKFAVRKPFVSP